MKNRPTHLLTLHRARKIAKQGQLALRKDALHKHPRVIAMTHLCSGISEVTKEADGQAAGSSHMGNQISEQAAQPRNEGLHLSAEERGIEERPTEALRQVDEADASVRIILDNSKMGLASHELSFEGSENIQQGIASIQRGLANINVTSKSLPNAPKTKSEASISCIFVKLSDSIAYRKGIWKAESKLLQAKRGFPSIY